MLSAQACAPLDALDMRLLDEWQRDFPLTSRPFANLAQRLDLDEADVLTRLTHLSRRAAISRIGAVVRPNSVGVSTLAALAVPEAQLARVARLVNAEAGVNHNYHRENRWNLWFVATGPDRDHLSATLARITQRSGLPLLDLPMERAFHLDLGFSLRGQAGKPRARTAAVRRPLDAGARQLLDLVAQGLPLTPRPYQQLAVELGTEEAAVLRQLDALCRTGVISRFGVVVRHRALGWRANAMLVWDLPDHQVAAAGQRLAALPGVTLCYQRRRDKLHWPFNLYAMVHAKTREQAQQVIAKTTALPELTGARSDILYSLRCFKQTGALLGKTRRTA